MYLYKAFKVTCMLYVKWLCFHSGICFMLTGVEKKLTSLVQRFPFRGLSG